MSRYSRLPIDLSADERRVLEQIASGRLTATQSTSAIVEYLRRAGLVEMPKHLRYGQHVYLRPSRSGRQYLQQQEKTR